MVIPCTGIPQNCRETVPSGNPAIHQAAQGASGMEVLMVFSIGTAIIALMVMAYFVWIHSSYNA
jgi:hypothetical protein